MYFNREDFAHFAKSSKAIKNLVEKEIKAGSRPGSRGGSRPGTPSKSRKNVNIDKVLTAFKVIHRISKNSSIPPPLLRQLIQTTVAFWTGRSFLTLPGEIVL